MSATGTPACTSCNTKARLVKSLQPFPTEAGLLYSRLSDFGGTRSARANGGIMSMTKRITVYALASVAAAFLIQASFVGDANGAPASDAGKTMSQIYRERGKEAVEFQKVPPIKLFDNVWYVGPGYVSCYLIKTSAGLILIDASEEPDMVLHGIDSMHELSGAPVWATEEDWQMIEQAAARPGRNGAPPPRAPKRDRVITDGQLLTLGDTTLKL